jgi:glyoxylase-like metal-dependent hydrolase (beta-lactamase superfamily II)
VHAQPAGPASTTIGDIRLTLIPDGYHRCDPTKTFLGSTVDDWRDHPHLLDDHGRLVMTMGSILAELPSGVRVLIDLGFGPRTLILSDLGMEFWGGRLLSSLTAIGVPPDAIDVVVYSHLHVDHVGWAADADDGSLTFDQARHVLSAAEWEHWHDKPDLGGPSADQLEALTPRVEVVSEEEVAPGITAVPTPGHTPGHLSFRVESRGERAIVLGDAVHCPLQISRPEWAFIADAAPDVARASRERLLRELDGESTFVVGPHFPDAVFGRVLATESSRHVAFDVAPITPPQRVAPEAPAGAVELRGLD